MRRFPRRSRAQQRVGDAAGWMRQGHMGGAPPRGGPGLALCKQRAPCQAPTPQQQQRTSSTAQLARSSCSGILRRAQQQRSVAAAGVPWATSTCRHVDMSTCRRRPRRAQPRGSRASSRALGCGRAVRFGQLEASRVLGCGRAARLHPAPPRSRAGARAAQQQRRSTAAGASGECGAHAGASTRKHLAGARAHVRAHTCVRARAPQPAVRPSMHYIM